MNEPPKYVIDTYIIQTIIIQNGCTRNKFSSSEGLIKLILHVGRSFLSIVESYAEAPTIDVGVTTEEDAGEEDEGCCCCCESLDEDNAAAADTASFVVHE